MSRPARIGLEAIAPGHEFRSARRTLTETDIVSFSAITGDYSPLHADEVFARDHSPFGTRIAQGWLLVAIQSGLSCEIDEWRILAYLATERRFVAPVHPGDTIHAAYRVDKVRPSSSKPDRGVVTLSCTIVNQDGQDVVTGTEVFLVERSPDT